MSPERAELELKATWYCLNALPGIQPFCSGPFNADSEPQTFEEIEPIARSKQDNYITVEKALTPTTGTKMNADSIVNRTIRFASFANDGYHPAARCRGKPASPRLTTPSRIIDYFKKRMCVHNGGQP